MRILCIDPGYAIVGFGILEAEGGRAQLLGCGAINTPRQAGGMGAGVTQGDSHRVRRVVGLGDGL